MSIPSVENPLFSIKEYYVARDIKDTSSAVAALIIIDVYKTAAKVRCSFEKFQKSNAETIIEETAEEIKDDGLLEDLVVSRGVLSLERNEDMSEADSKEYYTEDTRLNRPVFEKVKNITYALSASTNRTDLVGITLRGAVQGLMRSHFPKVPHEEIQIPFGKSSQKA